MADQAQRLKTITDNIEATYQALRRSAGAIAGLLQAGRATCDEVRAYNLWALAIYNTQRGMLATLRANGEKGVPELPPAPTLFTWKGVAGADAWKVSCAGQPSSLSGALGRAMRGPDESTQFLSTNEIEISTQDPYLMNPESAPSFKTLYQVQEARAKQEQAALEGSLGAAWVIVVAIAGIAIAVSVAIAAIMQYLETSEVQEANTKQVKLQAEAFANYTAARLSCYASCTQSGKTTEQCVEICKGLVDKPNIKLPGQDKSWGMLQWIGFTVVAGVGALAAVRVYQRRKAGKPIFELPEPPGGDTVAV